MIWFPIYWFRGNAGDEHGWTRLETRLSGRIPTRSAGTSKALRDAKGKNGHQKSDDRSDVSYSNNMVTWSAEVKRSGLPLNRQYTAEVRFA